MAAEKPTLVLVPGSFVPPSFYTNVISAFSSKGYSIQAVDTCTVGKKPGAPPTMYDDAAHIASVVSKLADEGKDIVLVAHSYGGIPTSESLKGLSKDTREKEGKKGGVVRVAYMTAVVPELEENSAAVFSVLGDQAPSAYTAVDEDGWMFHPTPEITAGYVFSDLSPEEGLKWVNKFEQHSVVSFTNELTYAGYKDVPVSYLFCEEDKCVPPMVQQRCIDVIEKASGRNVDVTRVKNDHCPSVSAPEKVVDWFVHLVEIGGKA